MNIFAQIIGVIAILVFAIIPHQKNKNKILILQLFSSLLYAIQYFILGAFSAVVTNIIDMIKTIVFSKYVRKDKKIPITFFIIYVLAMIISGIFTVNNFISVLPILGVILYTYAIWQENLKVFRIMNVFVILIYIIYNFCVGAYTSCLGSVFQLISAIIAIINLDIKKCPRTEKNTAI